jgi:DNA-directed RNA polymerase specialized sigma24 family protein
MGQDSNLNLAEKLDRGLRLLAITAIRGMPQTAQIATLSRVGFPPKEIAEILGTTANTVRVALVSIRRGENHRSVRLSGRAEGETDA